MDRLKGDSSLHTIVSTTNEIIDVVNSSMEILKTLDTNSIGEQIKYTATQSSEITGEVYTIEIPGIYTIKTSGAGTTSVLIQKSGESEVSKTIVLYTDQESEEILLTSKDKLLFYVTSSRNSYSVSMFLKKGLFSVTQEFLDIVESNANALNELKSQITNSIDAYTKEYEELTKSNNDLQKFIDEQLVSINDTLEGLSNRISEIQGQK